VQDHDLVFNRAPLDLVIFQPEDFVELFHW
jgi:hypothetical protein